MSPLLDILGSIKARYDYGHELTLTQKWTLVRLLDELMDMMNSHWEQFQGDLDFKWAMQSAISMQFAEHYYRNYENISTGVTSKKYIGLNEREIAMLNSMIWRINLNVTKKQDSKSKETKMIVINHVIHTKTTTQYQDDVWGYFVPMGQNKK